jgi:hypothetical protein
MRESAPCVISHRGEASWITEVIPCTPENLAMVRYNATLIAISLLVTRDARTMPQSALHLARNGKT